MALPPELDIKALLSDFDELFELSKPEILSVLVAGRKAEILTRQLFETLLEHIMYPERTEADGRIVGLHIQLARARFADTGASNGAPMGTPPRRCAWSLADRCHEPIRRGSAEWAKAKQISINRGHEESAPVKLAAAEPAKESAPIAGKSTHIGAEYAPAEQDGKDEDSSEDEDSSDDEDSKELPPVNNPASITENAPPAEESAPVEVKKLAPAKEDRKYKPGTWWGCRESGRDSQESHAARLRCARRQASQLYLVMASRE